MKQILLLLVFLLLSRELSPAWSSPGHMTIAAIAYRELSDSQRQAVTELLKHHPDYESWKQAWQMNIPDFDLDTFIFMRASTWPDEIRRRGNPYDHPEWHYIDYPLEPPAFPDKPSPFPTNDILYGIKQSEKIIKDPNSSPEVRAAYFSWLIHLVGDSAGTKCLVDVPIIPDTCTTPQQTFDFGCNMGIELVAGKSISGDSCFGDSGGPAYIRQGKQWCVAALTSREITNAPTNQPCGYGSVYLRLHPYIDWISNEALRYHALPPH